MTLAAAACIGGCHELLPLAPPAELVGDQGPAVDQAPQDLASRREEGPWPDLLPPDHGPATDLAPADGSRNDGALSCLQQFACAPGTLTLCAETATQCVMYHYGGGSCDDICLCAGGTCLGVIDDDDDSDVCVGGVSIDCDSSHLDLVCTCSR